MMRVLVKGANKNKQTGFTMTDEGRDNQFILSLHVQLACPFLHKTIGFVHPEDTLHYPP